jgi:hypothetical protein
MLTETLFFEYSCPHRPLRPQGINDTRGSLLEGRGDGDAWLAGRIAPSTGDSDRGGGDA